MIDYRDLKFDSSAVQGITVALDRHLGPCIVGETEGGIVLARLAAKTDPFEAHFFKSEEKSDGRFFVPNCALRLDMEAVLDRRNAADLGCLIVAERGISIMVRPPRMVPAPMRLTGSDIDEYEGFCITRWRIESPPAHGEPEILYDFPPAGGLQKVPIAGI